MTSVKLIDDHLEINLSLFDKLLALHGSLHIPLAHVTNAYVSSFEDLQIQFKLEGTNFGYLKTAGVYANPSGLIFCDVSGFHDCLVIETQGERFPKIAVQLRADDDPNAVAHEIMRRLPDAGPT